MPLLLIPLVLIGVVLLLVVPIMLIYMLFKFLAFPLIILLIVWFCRRISPQAKQHTDYFQHARSQHFAGRNWSQPSATRPRRKDVTDNAQEHDTETKPHHDQQRWDDF